MSERIRLVIFDWAGTTVDYGCFAPVAPFIEVLQRNGVAISTAQARGPMGLDKKEHLRILLELPGAAQQWRDAHGGAATAEDVDRLFDQMAPLAVESVREYSGVIGGVTEMARELRRRGIVIGGTTGYFAEAARACAVRAAADGYVPDATFCASDVPQARPAPWMIFRNMEALGVWPTACVLKVGDTVPDIEESRSAGCWSAGVIASGNEIGLTAAQLAALAHGERDGLLASAANKLKQAGAHATLETLAELPALIDDIDAQLATGARPHAPVGDPVHSA